jgi:hypothetical protein
MREILPLPESSAYLSLIVRARPGKPMNETKITALREELKSIHVADVLYWTAGEEPNRAARAEYKRRQDRLREIRAELYGYLVAQASVTSESTWSCLPLTQRA